MIKTIPVKVIPNAKRNLIKPQGDGFKVYLTAPAVDGKANKALITLLAQYLGVRRRQVEVTKGLKSREKMIKIGGI